MSKGKILLLILLLSGICSLQANALNNEKVLEITKSTDITWEFTSKDDADGTPTTKVSVLINGVKFEIISEIGSFYEIPPSDFKSNKIPNSALTACQGWWAGAGCQLWIVDAGKSYNVIRRDIEEGNPDHPSDYLTKPKKIKSIMID